MEWQSRTELLLGKKQLEKLQKSHVLVAGVGGVGAYAIEMLVRAGVGEITMVDADIVKSSNRNRQLIALTSTEGRAKVEVMRDRALDINPLVKINIKYEFLKDGNIPMLLEVPYDYIIDAIDSLSPKTYFIVNCLKNKIPLISSMGAGGKIDPTKVQICDISKSYHCKLAKMVRKRLSKFQIKDGFDVVFSPEPTSPENVIFIDDEKNKKTTVGTISYMPTLFGILAASKVIRELITKDNTPVN
ncbi:MAG TPA: tRNA threonylcarbamoyladenosine dehydratase [Marinilabiliaceae bacterium]|nr:tRNA threonylcarbamoyladenosine dehydratase [Marinilabiliaceae bacterium]